MSMLDWQVRLTEAMADKGMTQAQLARQIGVPAPTVFTWMGTGDSAKPIKDIRAIPMVRACIALSVRPEWLMLGELPKHPHQTWPFTVPREKVESLPVIVRILVDRIIADIVGVLAPNHTSE
jgi:DNA-binding Xre family transcriptional regulator